MQRGLKISHCLILYFLFFFIFHHFLYNFNFFLRLYFIKKLFLLVIFNFHISINRFFFLIWCHHHHSFLRCILFCMTLIMSWCLLFYFNCSIFFLVSLCFCFYITTSLLWIQCFTITSFIFLSLTLGYWGTHFINIIIIQ